MGCLQPYLRIKSGYKKRPFEDDGILIEKARIVYDLPSNRKKLDEVGQQYDVIPCGCCDECYKKRVREWSIRILNETRYHHENYFITLTYDNKHLPKGSSVDKEGVQKFFKRLKDYFRNIDKSIKFKYYCVAEYGEGKGERLFINPHYHFISFGLPLINYGLTSIFPDGREHFSQSGDKLYYSPLLTDLWCDCETRENLGFVTVQDVTFGSASYVAGYVHKKLKESKPVIHEEVAFFRSPDGRALALIVPRRYDPYEALGIAKPFSLMSKGIGEQFLIENEEKIYKTDEIFYNSGEFGVLSSLPPRYYDKKLAQHNPDKAKSILDNRKDLANSTIKFDKDKDYLYNKSVRQDLIDSKRRVRKRGLTSLS